MRRYFRLAIGILLVVLTSMLLVAPNADAREISVGQGTCSIALYTNTDFNTASFALGPHPTTQITLLTTYSYGWGYKWTSYGPVVNGSIVPNHYNVRMLDGNRRVVWTEYNSVRNGGIRIYNVGSNVRFIQVSSDYYYYGWVVQPAVGLRW
jgi:hypothetical protein